MIKDVTENPAGLTENDLWESWDSVARGHKRAFMVEKVLYQKNLRKSKGSPEETELKKMAFQLSRHIDEEENETLWQRLSFYDEEAIRYITGFAAKILAQQNGWTNEKRRQIAGELYRRAVWKKFNQPLGR